MKPGKKIMMLLFLASATRVLFAQDNKPESAIASKQTVVRVNIIGVPAFNFEKGFGSNFTIRPEAGLGWPVITHEKNANGKRIIKMESAVNPYLLLEGRYYYNMQKRILNGKRTQNFSADYIAAFYRYNAYEYQQEFSNDNDDHGELMRDVQYVGAWWGIQRSFFRKQRFYINWSLGPSIKTNWIDYVDLSFTSQLGIGLQW